MYTLKKSLGQHFLHDENICQRIVVQMSYPKGLQLVEVGPGGGALTKYLLEKEDINYKAIEVDSDKVSYLLTTYPQLKDKLLHVDFLKSDCPFEGQFSVIGNFPYNISTQIVFRILDWKDAVDEMVGMFQKEVAQRIAAPHGNKIYGILSVLVQTFFKVDYLFDVHENCFTPPPKVKSGVIKFTNAQNPYQIRDAKKYFKMVKTAFGQRRKTLRNALKPMFPAAMPDDEMWSKRAEQLSVAEFVALYKRHFTHE